MSAAEHLGRQFKFFDMSGFRDQRADGRWLGEADGVRAYGPDGKDQHGFLKLNHEGNKVDEVWVHPDHRRQGLATAMIRFAEEKTGRKLPPGDDRSDAGEALARKLGAPPRTVHQKWDGIGMYEP